MVPPLMPMAGMRINFAFRKWHGAVSVVYQDQTDAYSAEDEAKKRTQHVAAWLLGLCLHVCYASAQLRHPHEEEHSGT